GAEIARAVVNFVGPIVFVVVSRYHGGAYVVFSQSLNPGLEAAALRGSFASVIGGGPAAAVVFTREVRARASAHPAVRALQDALRRDPSAELRARLEAAREEATLAAQAELALEFDAVHSVERARSVGSLREIVEPEQLRPFVVRALRRELSSRFPETPSR
ncbi:MAG TPA: carboxyl transferase domain-containing protein, partial [Myxococcota bacterium]|nr:carboxyl transferase domain-containing protein [Myxococcota bacterium]